jgi:hypothetical protein
MVPYGTAVRNTGGLRMAIVFVRHIRCANVANICNQSRAINRYFFARSAEPGQNERNEGGLQCGAG